MKNKTKIAATMVGMIFLLSCVSALDLKAGECSVLDIQVEGEVTWEVPEGIYITQNGSEIEVCLDILFESGNFTLEFFNEQKEIIVNHYSGGGGGGIRTIYKDRNVTKYVDKEVKVEVPGETIEIEGLVIKKLPTGILFLIIAFLVGGLIMTALYFIERQKRKGDEIDEQRKREAMQ